MPESRRDGRDSNDMAMLIGQLVAATETASKGIESLTREARDNATALAAATKSLEIVEKMVTALNNLIHDGGDDNSVVAQLRSLRSTNENLRNMVDGLKIDFEKIKKSVGGFEATEQKFSGGWSVLLWIMAGLGWLVSLSLAVYEAIKK